MLQQQEATVSLRTYVIVVACAAIVVGFIMLFVPLKAGVDCGSLADPDRIGPAVLDTYLGRSGSAESCANALDTQQGWVIGLIAGGLVVALGAYLTGPRPQPAPGPPGAGNTPGGASPP